jgi:surfeit locus 1 family protein
MLKLFFNRQRWWTTLLAVIAVGVMIGLGFWQLDRLQQRRAFNARVAAQIQAPPIELTAESLNADLIHNLTTMEYRAVSVTGQYDHTHEIALRNQAFQDQLGVNLLTPLIISGTHQAVLINRGWIPFQDAAPDKWNKFAAPGIVQVRGVIRYSQARADFGGINDPPGTLKVWNLINLARIQEQMPYPLLPVYIQQTPDGNAVISEGTPFTMVNIPTSAKPIQITLPARSSIQVDLSEGSHLVYAIQWFTFAAMVGMGYPYLVVSRAKKSKERQR